MANRFKFTLILSLLNVPFSLYALYLYAPNFEVIGGGDLRVQMQSQSILKP